MFEGVKGMVEILKISEKYDSMLKIN